MQQGKYNVREFYAKLMTCDSAQFLPKTSTRKGPMTSWVAPITSKREGFKYEGVDVFEGICV